MPNETSHDIFSKPLPEILDELVSATADAKKAAEDVRTAGEKAAEDVMIRLRKLFLTMVKDITTELGETKK
jgi:hypothetical protein